MFPFLLNVRHFGAIHLVRKQNFRKKKYLRHALFVSGGKKC